MSKYFNVNADCKPNMHYMVHLDERLKEIKKMIERGDYFTINRARQYGKTTTLKALEYFLKEDYLVISLDFQMLSASKFKNENTFSVAFATDFLEALMFSEQLSTSKEVNDLKYRLENQKETLELFELFRHLSKICATSPKPIVLMIDEVDSASNNQVFVDFLAQLRGYYIKREVRPIFQSVILAGVYDIKNIQQKFRTDNEHKINSPWNIAADFLIDMSFSVKDISDMLMEYEKDYHTNMNISEIAQLLYDYTSGYPFLVSKLCKLIDENISNQHKAWNKEGILEAVRILLGEKNTLFESLFHKLEEYPRLKDILYILLFQGNSILYNPDDPVLDMALMFGIVKVKQESIIIANRIFETRLYNMFLALPDVQNTDIYKAAFQSKNQFIENGHLNVTLILQKFVEHFHEIYGSLGQKFIEEDGRRYFMLYLKPIINGTGNYYIEAQTRTMERTDMIIDYCGEQFVIEMKIWHGNAYNMRGEKQLMDYLDYYHLKKGYMLSFNFNKKKEIGVKRIKIEDKVLVEAVV